MKRNKETVPQTYPVGEQAGMSHDDAVPTVLRMHVNMKDASAETSQGTWAMPSNASVAIVSTLTPGEQTALRDTLAMMEHPTSMHPELAKQAADLRQALSEVQRPACSSSSWAPWRQCAGRYR